MHLSISNIAWNLEYDNEMYAFLQNQGFSGLEIAPTRLFTKAPYDNLKVAKKFSVDLKNKYSLEISSMQSIWFGRNENIFNSKEDRTILFEYTKKAIDFANIIKCKNLVFGCPKNRNINFSKNSLPLYEIVNEFFLKLGEYAYQNGTYVSIEPNPVIYNTNFINTTEEAFKLVKDINSKGLKVNVDLGAIIYNNENLDFIKKYICLINHIHISEPFLGKIQVREMHKELYKILKTDLYDKFISIEMKNFNDINQLKNTIKYVKGIFK